MMRVKGDIYLEVGNRCTDGNLHIVFIKPSR